MRVFRFTLKDLYKDAGWILLASIAAAIIISELVYMVVAQGWSAQQLEAFNWLEEKNIHYVTVSDNRALIGNTNHRISNVISRYAKNYLKENVTLDGVAGLRLQLSVSLPGEGGNSRNAYCLAGRACELADYPYKASDGIRVLASEKLIHEIGPTISLERMSFAVEEMPSDFVIREFYIQPSVIEESFVFFCPTFEDLVTIFPDYYSLLDVNNYLRALFLFDPTEEDILLCREAALKGSGVFLEVHSVDDRMRQESRALAPTLNRVSLFFYCMTAVALLVSLLFVQYRILSKRIPDYAIHHLCGSGEKEILLRIGLTCLIGYIPSFVAIAVITDRDHAKYLPYLPLIAVAILLLSAGMTWFIFEKFRKSPLEYLRRKNG